MFQYKVIKEGGKARYFGISLGWISDSEIGFEVYRLKTFEIPLRAYHDLSTFKYYFNDTGLLLPFYEENIQNRILQGDVGVFKGGYTKTSWPNRYDLTKCLLIIKKAKESNLVL